MKRIKPIALFLASLFLAGYASAQDHVVQATIPFDFTVGTKLLPAGTYQISSDDKLSNVIEIQNPQQHITVLSTVYAGDAKPRDSKLVFNKYGDEYFLREILCSRAQMSMDIATSKLEKRARTQESQLHGVEQAMVELK